MSLSDILFDWAATLQPLLQPLGDVELALRKLWPYLTVLCGVVLLLYLLTLASVDITSWWKWRRQTRVSRLLAKFRSIREKIAGKGQARRRRLADDRNAGISRIGRPDRRPLRSIRGYLQHGLYKRTRRFVAKAVADLDFDRLYALHRLLALPDAKQVVSRLEVFLPRAR
jgi:hypothetical protein